MPRIARTDMNANFLHIMVQGNNRIDIFISDKLKQKYVDLIKDKQEKYDIMIIAYCIMDNHAHLLIYSNDILEISNYMKRLNQSYSQYYNKLNGKIGTNFRNRFQSEEILNQQYLKNCISYIHHNPIKAGKCKLLNEYKFSSYNEYMTKTGIVTKELINLIFLDDTKYYEKLKLLHEKSYRFIDYIGDENPSILLKKYLVERNIKYELIKNNDIWLLDVVNMLKDNLGLSFRQISDLLKVDRRRIKKIIEENNEV